MERRRFLVGLASGTLTIPLAGCSGAEVDEPNENQGEEDATKEGEDTSKPDSSGDETDVPEDKTDISKAAPDPITFEGDGQTVTTEFDLVGGFVIADMEHTGGNSNFQVQLIDEESGDNAGLLANEIGEWSGQIGETFDAGTYVLDINADGEWSVEFRQPRPTKGDEPPVEKRGTSSTVLGPYQLDGRVEISGSHNGSRNFIVRTHDAKASDSTYGNLIFNEIGEFEGRTTFAGQGLTWLTIRADGDWTITIE